MANRRKRCGSNFFFLHQWLEGPSNRLEHSGWSCHNGFAFDFLIHRLGGNNRFFFHMFYDVLNNDLVGRDGFFEHVLANL